MEENAPGKFGYTLLNVDEPAIVNIQNIMNEFSFLHGVHILCRKGLPTVVAIDFSRTVYRLISKDEAPSHREEFRYNYSYAHDYTYNLAKLTKCSQLSETFGLKVKGSVGFGPFSLKAAGAYHKEIQDSEVSQSQQESKTERKSIIIHEDKAKVTKGDKKYTIELYDQFAVLCWCNSSLFCERTEFIRKRSTDYITSTLQEVDAFINYENVDQLTKNILTFINGSSPCSLTYASDGAYFGTQLVLNSNVPTRQKPRLHMVDCRNYILVVPEDYSGIVMEYLGEKGGLSWQGSSDYAAQRGGRLLSAQELQQWIGNSAKTPQEDQWVPVEGANSWVQIGDKPWRPGTNHLELGYSPDWGKTQGGADQLYRKYIVYKL